MCSCREAVIGLVLVKELVLIDMFANIPVSALSMRPIPHLRADTAMYDLLKLFQTGRTHMVLLTKPPPGAKLLAAQATGSANSRADLAVNIGPQTMKRVAEEVCLSLLHLTRSLAQTKGCTRPGRWHNVRAVSDQEAGTMKGLHLSMKPGTMQRFRLEIANHVQDRDMDAVLNHALM